MLAAGGEAEQPGDLQSGGPLRVDEQVDAHVPLEAVGVYGVLDVADPGDGEGGAHVLGRETGDHVDLVHAGGRDQDVCVLGPCLPQGGDRRTVALDAHHIQRLVRLSQGLVAGVHNGDIVLLLGQLLGQGIADLSITHDDDVQLYPTPL